MTAANADFFDLAASRMAYLERRQSVLAQNVANADTPTWRTRDLKPFSETIQRAAVAALRTDPMHLAARTGGASDFAASGERAPDGNAVSLDAQLVKVAETDQSQAMTVDLYKKYLGMFRTALGR